jgi:hypothetical protein
MVFDSAIRLAVPKSATPSLRRVDSLPSRASIWRARMVFDAVFRPHRFAGHWVSRRRHHVAAASGDLSRCRKLSRCMRIKPRCIPTYDSPIEWRGKDAEAALQRRQ